MSAHSHEAVSGYLATFAIFVSGLGIVYRPVRLAPVAIILAMVAVAMGSERTDRLTQIAVVACVVGWMGGMTAAVITGAPLW